MDLNVGIDVDVNGNLQVLNSFVVLGLRCLPSVVLDIYSHPGGSLMAQYASSVQGNKEYVRAAGRLKN